MDNTAAPKTETKEYEADEILEAELDQEPEADASSASEPSAEASEASEGEPATMPTPLLSLFAKMLLGAAGAAILSTCLLLYFGTIQCGIGYLLSAYLVYQSWALRRDYMKGEITELAVICSSITNNLTRSNTRVMFRSIIENDTDVPEYYEFYVPGNSGANKDLMPTYVYVIYYRKRDPKKLLGYYQL